MKVIFLETIMFYLTKMMTYSPPATVHQDPRVDRRPHRRARLPGDGRAEEPQRKQPREEPPTASGVINEVAFPGHFFYIYSAFVSIFSSWTTTVVNKEQSAERERKLAVEIRRCCRCKIVFVKIYAYALTSTLLT